jgi:glycosyltransferase involved in cell wall biosynthesis
MTRRVLHCIPGMGGGGAERQLAYLSGELVRRGWEVHVALVSGGPNLERLRSGGATIHRLQARSNYDPTLLWQLARAMESVRPDVVQVWMLQMEILGALAARYRGVPWIFSERCSELAYPPTAKNRLRAWVAGTATAIVANSRGGREYWDERLASGARFVIPNALPTAEIASVAVADETRTGIPASGQLVLFAGRLTDQKDPMRFVRALATVLRRPDIVGVVAGDGPLRDAVEAEVRLLGLADRVRFTGYLDDVWAWMKRANVFVSPSLFEGHPNTVLEAAACGSPLVVSDIAAHRELLDADSASWVRAGGAADELSTAILQVLDDPPGARTRAARAARGVAELSVERIAQEYDRVYMEVIELAGRRNGGPPR